MVYMTLYVKKNEQSLISFNLNGNFCCPEKFIFKKSRLFEIKEFLLNNLIIKCELEITNPHSLKG